jgi:hypothetical protein
MHDDNQHRSSSDVVQRRADDKGRLARAGHIEPVLTVVDIARSVQHARQVVSVSVEVRVTNEELRYQCALLRQRADNARQESKYLRDVTRFTRN